MNQPASLTDMLSHLLDRDFIRITGPVLVALLQNTRVMAAVAAFRQEANRLADLNQPLHRSNAVIGNLRGAVEASITQQKPHIESAALALEAGAIATGANMAQQMALAGGVNTHMPWDVVRSIKQYTDSRAWQEQLASFGPDTGKRVADIAIAGIIDGQNPLDIASSVEDAVTAIPRSQAESLLRTLQLETYRRSAADNYSTNADLLEPEGIRIASLDDRTCLACIELHGTRVPLDADIETHYGCRCTVIPVARGASIDIQTGEDWFNELDDVRQERIMGGAAYRAWSDGAVTLSDFVSRGHDPIFGPQATQSSLKGILGNGAKAYYSRKTA